MKFHQRMLAVTAVAGALFGFGSAQAGTIIYNTGAAATASVALGVNDDGSLNTSDGNIVVNSGATGLAYNFGTAGWRDATSPGCLCEGWGVQANGVNGGASVENNGGAFNLTFGAATGVTGSTVTTMSTLTSLSQVSIKHEFAPADAAPGALFKVNVTITNTGDTALTGVRYVRAMDWDVPMTEFDEFVTIKGTGTTTLLEQSNDNGFCSVNPGDICSELLAGTTNVDFTDAGPADHGAYFKFNFGDLAGGESYGFTIFYGATGTERDALAAIAAEGIELYSLGQSNGGEVSGSPATFIFGFKGVGGVPQGVPEPGSLLLAGAALAALGGLRRRAARRA